LYLSRVEIRNFRLFQALDLKLNRGLNVLVGENDSGKTSLVDAVRYALGTNSSDWTSVIESDFFDNSDELSIRLKFSEVDAHAHRFVEHLSHEEYTVADGDRKRRSVLYVQLRAQKTGIERRGYPYIRTEVRSGVDGNGPLLEPDIRSFLATTYLKPLRDAEAELSAGRSSRLSQILSSSKDIREGVDEILTIIANANQSLLADDAALKKSAANIREDYLHKLIFERDKDTLGVFIDIAGIRSDQLDGLQETEKRRHLRAVLEGLSLTLTDDRRLHGLGYHNLLFMAAELLLLEQEASKEFPLLLVEEPEAHLHPQLQMKLLQFINSRAKTEANPDGVQCILTTHSPNISSKADPSEIVLLSRGSAWPFRSRETELAEEDYVYLRKFLDVTKANVFFAKALVFVEGDAENILLPEVASLLGRPLESYGVSVVKYDNSGSWKRFAKLFLRTGKDEDASAWVPTKVCVLRDLDLRPLCAEKKDDGTNPYGFLRRQEPGPDGRGGNLAYWEHEDAENRKDQIETRKEGHKKDVGDGSSLERQCIKVSISDRWTFEFCLARYGLFSECCEALGIDANIQGTEDEKATYVQSNASKTDLAYTLAETLRKQRDSACEAAIAVLTPEQRQDAALCDRASRNAMDAFALSFKARLPPYIVEAIEYVTAPIPAAEGEKEVGYADAGTA
jgi:putative ATP-dependent endonuclease of OLD family